LAGEEGARAPGYRPEIDGLRAIAVLAVLLFHTRITGFSGGFVGVDIFLVISGYLIAQVILRESDAGSFTLIGFYERRVRRILPALLAMLLASSVAALILLPGDLAHFGQSLTAIALFASNLLFWSQGGYFGLTTSATPLLHSWSLAVEEQFYILFPALLLLARRGGRRTLHVALALAALGSFAFSAWATRDHPQMAFYSPLSRAWEFLVGALLATGAIPASEDRDPGDVLAGLGLGAIGYAICTLDDTSPFPGLNALVPVTGTLLILAGTQAEESRVAAMLRVRPLVAIGLISYSLYLWHWPMIVFGGYYAFNPLGPISILMAVLSVPVAWASWRYIELPFRKPRLLLSRRALLTSALAASAALAGYGMILCLAHGFPQRFSPAVQRLSRGGPQPDYGCADRSITTVRDNSRCRIGPPGTRPSFALWGDSHAAVFFPALDTLARRHGVSGYDLTQLGCPPLLPIRARQEKPDQWMFRPYAQEKCRARNAKVEQFLAEQRPGVVLLAAHWPVYAGGMRPVVEVPGADAAAFGAGVARLRALGIRVYVVLDVPDAPWAQPDRLAKAALFGTTHRLETDLASHLDRYAAFRAIADGLARQGLVEIIDPAQRLCSHGICRVTDQGFPLYFDANHLNARGARYVEPIFEPMMRSLKPPAASTADPAP
jgi:peptidoglycan/LPS O-acetylase OafA/YrhL